MSGLFLRNCVLAVMMVCAAGLTRFITPDIFTAAIRPLQNLHSLIPTAFGEWQEEKSSNSAVVNPQTESLLKNIYTQTLSRTYVNSKGERVMLSIAYGNDQRDENAVHYPEVCYPAQGFKVASSRRDILKINNGEIFVKRLETSLANQRFEPVTYWTMVGNLQVKGGVDKKIIEIRHAIEKGEIPDGLIFRVSSLNFNSSDGFRLQDRFVSDLANALTSTDKIRLMGI